MGDIRKWFSTKTPAKDQKAKESDEKKENVKKTDEKEKKEEKKPVNNNKKRAREESDDDADFEEPKVKPKATPKAAPPNKKGRVKASATKKEETKQPTKKRKLDKKEDEQKEEKTTNKKEEDNADNKKTDNDEEKSGSKKRNSLKDKDDKSGSDKNDNEKESKNDKSHRKSKDDMDMKSDKAKDDEKSFKKTDDEKSRDKKSSDKKVHNASEKKIDDDEKSGGKKRSSLKGQKDEMDVDEKSNDKKSEKKIDDEKSGGKKRNSLKDKDDKSDRSDNKKEDKETKDKKSKKEETLDDLDDISEADDEKSSKKDDTKNTEKSKKGATVNKKTKGKILDLGSDEDEEIKPVAGKKKDTKSPNKDEKKITSPTKDAKKSPSKGETITSPSKDEKKPAAGRRYFGTGGQRRAPPLKGQVPLPVGEPYCLSGKVFIITGDLESLERDEAAQLIEQYGGKVAKTLLKSLTHAVVGTEPGPSKIKHFEEAGIPQLSEQDLFALITTSKGQKSPPKPKTPIKPKPSSIIHTPSPAPVKKEKEKEKEQRVKQPVIESGLWADKYKPTKTSELVGNSGYIKDLLAWLRAWNDRTGGSGANIKAKGRGKQPKANDNGFKAVLISGPPGIGKTTTALLACREAGFEPIEFNASDTRSKKSLQDSIAHMVGNDSLSKYFGLGAGTHDSSSNAKNARNNALVMDEVDGMSSGDRGGVAELISYIKITKIPVICICNDRYAQKLKSLGNHCLDLRFKRTPSQQIMPRIANILKAEGAELEPRVLDNIITSTHSDIRQVLTMLQMWCDKGQTPGTKPTVNSANVTDKQITLAKKNMEINLFDAVFSLFSYSPQTPFYEKEQLYFADPSLIPLMVQENYLNSSFASSQNARRSNLAMLDLMSRAADSLSLSDLVDVSIRRDQNWEMMPLHASLSCIRTCFFARGSLTESPHFPTLLGRTSNINKRLRLLKELQSHMKSTISANKSETGLDYLALFRSKLTTPLIEKQQEGIDEVMSVMERYEITRDDWDSVLELTQWPGMKDLTKDITTKAKAAFTRKYNAESHTMKIVPVKHTRKATNITDESLIGVSEGDEDDDAANGEEDDVMYDKLISAGAAKSRGKKAAAEKPEPKKKGGQKK